MTEVNQRRRYPSDITELQWIRIKPLLPLEKETGRHRSTDMREVINGINFRWRTGCVWRMLPHDLPPWATVYAYFRDWKANGVLKQIRETLMKRTSSHSSHPNSVFRQPTTSTCIDSPKQNDRQRSRNKNWPVESLSSNREHANHDAA